MSTNKFRTYTELSSFKTLKERFDYLKLDGAVGKDTFGWDRYLNQTFYRSSKWKHIRDQVIVRDNGCDMGLEGYPIKGRIIIHHLTPILPCDFELENSPLFTDLENLVCVSQTTHNAIHYGDETLLPQTFVPRKPNDTCPWLG